MKLWTLHSSRESKSILNELHPTTDFQQLPEGNTVFEMYPTIPDTNSFQKRDNDQGGFTLYQQYPANSYSLLNQPAVSYPAMYHPLFLNYSYSSQGSLFDMLDQSARKVPPQNGNIFFNAHNSEPNLDN